MFVISFFLLILANICGSTSVESLTFTSKLKNVNQNLIIIKQLQIYNLPNINRCMYVSMFFNNSAVGSKLSI